MRPGEQQEDTAPPQSALGEVVGVLAELAAVLLLLGGCALLPWFVAGLVSPWLGMLVAAGTLWVWVRFGPRPFPGFLPGSLSVCGFVAILGSLIGCLVLAVRGLFP
jgi:hypothetical protein